jgi:hypothetical protein
MTPVAPPTRTQQLGLLILATLAAAWVLWRVW